MGLFFLAKRNPLFCFTLFLFFGVAGAFAEHESSIAGPNQTLIHSFKNDPQAPKTACQLIPTYGYKSNRDGLSPFWDREYAGLDLARKRVMKNKNYSVAIGLLDDVNLRPYMLPVDRVSKEYRNYSAPNEDAYLYGGHATATAGLIFGKEPLGGSATGKLTFYGPIATFFDGLDAFDHRDQRRVLRDYKDYLNRISQGNERLFSVSMSSRDNEDEEAFRNLLSQSPDKTLVQAAGNRGFFEKSAEDLARTRAFFVGASNSIGAISSFTAKNPSMNILAPADVFQGVPMDPKHVWAVNGSSFDPKTHLERFGGTSGATPLVTAALSNALALIPNLTSEELRTLAFESGFREPVVSKIYGLPLLNAYRLVVLTERINEECPYSDERPDPSLECRKDIWRNWQKNRGSFLDFSHQAKVERDRALDFLSSPDCEKRKEGLNALRRSFFLDPNAETAQALQKKYLDEGFPINAAFIQSFRLSPKDQISKLLTQTDLNAEERRGLKRDVGKLGLDLTPTIEQGLSASDLEVRERAVAAAGILSPQKTVEVLSRYLASENRPELLAKVHEAYEAAQDPYAAKGIPLHFLGLFQMVLEKRGESPEWQHALVRTVLDVAELGKEYATSTSHKTEEYQRAFEKAFQLLERTALQNSDNYVQSLAAQSIFMNSRSYFGSDPQVRALARKRREIAQVLLVKSANPQVRREAQSFLKKTTVNQWFPIMTPAGWWSKSQLAKRKISEAETACESHHYRLPNIDEARYLSAKVKNIFGDQGCLWTSTPSFHYQFKNQVWSFDKGKGGPGPLLANGNSPTCHALCVRSPEME